jgi:predicted Zn-dependent protease
MSKGALKSMNNEAHAAHFLAHEIAHLVQGHGEEHYKNNEHVIRKDRAISKLDRLVETDEKHKQTVKDLSVMADRIRDYLNRDELDSYELDADYWGMIYMSRARYHPFESVAYLKQNLIKRGDLPKASKAMWNGAKLETRIKKLEKEIRKQGQYPGNILEDEFLSYQRRLK